MQFSGSSRRSHSACSSRCKFHFFRSAYRFAVLESYSFTICIGYLHFVVYCTLFSAFVLYFALCTYSSLASFNVEVRSIYIHTCCSKIAEQRQSLVYRSGDMQFHMFRYTSVVGVEIPVVPLVSRILLSSFPICPAVVHTYRHLIVAVHVDVFRKVNSESHNTVLVKSRMLSVYPYICTLAYALELNEHFSAVFCTLRHSECLVVPNHRIAQFCNLHPESFILVESSWQ